MAFNEVLGPAKGAEKTSAIRDVKRKKVQSQLLATFRVFGVCLFFFVDEWPWLSARSYNC